MSGDLPEPLPPIAQPGSPLRRLAAGPLLVCLDFDGTLAPIVERPELAALPPGMADRLDRLATLVPTAVVSGRDLDDLRRRVPVPGIALVGSHGLEIARADGRVDRAPGLDRTDAQLTSLAAMLRQGADGIPGVLVETKRHSVAVHWRLTGPEDAGRAVRLVEATLRDYPAFGLGRGKMVAEFRPQPGRDKGGAVEILRATAGQPVPTVLYIGDDVTDEDAFRMLDAGRDVGIVVADPPRPSAARWQVPDPGAVASILDSLVSARAGRGARVSS